MMNENFTHNFWFYFLLFMSDSKQTLGMASCVFFYKASQIIVFYVN